MLKMRFSFILCLLAVLLTANMAHAQSAPLQALFPTLAENTRDKQAKNTAIDDATKAIQAFVKGDERTVVRYSYAPLLALTGGADALIKQMREAKVTLIERNAHVTTVAFGEPSEIVRTETQWRILIPQLMVLATPTGVLETSTTLLGISQDEGQSWQFADALLLKDAQMNILFPDYDHAALPIPASKEPVFIPYGQEDKAE